MAEETLDPNVQQAIDQVRKNSGWLMFMGVALIILGVVGLGMVGTLTLASVFVFGWLIIVAGVLVLVDGFKAEGWKAKLWEILIALLYIAAGVIVLVHPAASAVWFTMLLAIFLIASGIFRIIIGFQIKGEVKGWGWTVFGGIASIILAIMIFSQWPLSGLWVIGLFIAIEMIMQGTSMISIALAAKASKDSRAAAGA